jgi:hypothetical protein
MHKVFWGHIPKRECKIKVETTGIALLPFFCWNNKKARSRINKAHPNVPSMGYTT